jgi:hypothetical protein
MTNDPKLNLDVDAPDKVSTVLRAAANAYYEADQELMSAWQQLSTPWSRIARILERAATQIDKLT